jgi:hypothetical protein
MAHYTGCAPLRIGTVVRGKGVRLRGPRGWQALPDGGYEHFRA